MRCLLFIFSVKRLTFARPFTPFPAPPVPDFETRIPLSGTRRDFYPAPSATGKPRRRDVLSTPARQSDSRRAAVASPAASLRDNPCTLRRFRYPGGLSSPENRTNLAGLSKGKTEPILPRHCYLKYFRFPATNPPRAQAEEDLSYSFDFSAFFASFLLWRTIRNATSAIAAAQMNSVHHQLPMV